MTLARRLPFAFTELAGVNGIYAQAGEWLDNVGDFSEMLASNAASVEYVEFLWLDESSIF